MIPQIAAPGGTEFVIMLFMVVFVWGIPIAIVVWLIMTLQGIRRDVAAIRKRLEARQD
jgi:SNF family Na+-dependent transporter